VNRRLSGRRLAGIAALIAAVAGSANATAQTADNQVQAQALFEKGSRLLNNRHYEQACPALEQAQHLVPGIGVTMYLGECYQETGRLLQAWQEFDRARELATLKKDKRAILAGERADRLLVRLPKLRINVDSLADVDGLTITDDGAPVEKSAWYRARPAASRTHVIAVTAPARVPLQLTVDVPSTPDTVSVEVPALKEVPSASAQTPPAPSAVLPAPATAPIAPPAPVPAAQSAPPHREVGVQRIAGFALVGLGAIGLGVGTVAGLQARAKLADSGSNGHCRPDDQCDPTGLADRSAALSDASVSTVGFVAGAVLALGGGALLLTSPHVEEPRVAVVPRAEPGGASLLLQGRW
jgi:hypothetical protein